VQQSIVDLGDAAIDRFGRSSAQVHWDSHGPAIELPLVKKPKTRSQEGNDGCGAMDIGRERGRRARLVVILEERRWLWPMNRSSVAATWLISSG
jgi:hypothetical protein